MITLPTERRKAQSYNPKLMVLMGKPKSGKSTIMAALEQNLIIDLEDGYRALEVMVINAKNYNDLLDIAKAVYQKNLDDAKNGAEKPFYRFITLDNATRLEEFAIPLAANLYRNTAMGQKWGYLKNPDGTAKKDANGNMVIDPKADVRLLPNGSGYLYLREAVKKLVNMFKPLCETLILVTHVKDKQIKKEDMELTEVSVDLAGKTGDIICGEADAIG